MTAEYRQRRRIALRIHMPAAALPATLALALAIAPALANATTGGPPANDSLLEEQTASFLEDRGRAGSLVGSILAGAAMAHPFAPIIGSVAGFFIGKSTDYSIEADKAAQQQTHASRSLIPSGGEAPAGLALANVPATTGETTLAAPAAPGLEPPQTAGLAVPQQAPSAHPAAALALPSTAPLQASPQAAPSQSRQLAALCTNAARNATLPEFCYYFAR